MKRMKGTMTAHNAQKWSVAANLGQIGNRSKDGGPVQDAPAEEWAGTLRSLRRLGIDQIDPTDMWVPLAELSDARREEFKAVLYAEGFAMPSISLTRHSIVDDRDGERNLARAHRYLDIAPEFGAGVVNIGFMQPLKPAQESALWFWLADGHHDDPARRSEAVRRVRELGDHAQANGLELSLEMYEDTYLGSAHDAVAFVEEVGREAVGLNPDLGNLIRLHREIDDVYEMFEKVLPHSNFWHIKNYSRDVDPATGAYATSPTPLKYGYINYRKVIGRALELGYRGSFCCEHYGADSIGVVAENMEYVRSVLEYWQ